MDHGLRLGDWAGRLVEVVIDRQMGSLHPEDAGITYGVNYGYVPRTMAADGEPVDAYVLGASEPLEQCRGQVVAIIHRRDDIEDKLVVAVGGTWDEQSVAAAVAFQEQWFDSWVEMSDPPRGQPP